MLEYASICWNMLAYVRICTKEIVIDSLSLLWRGFWDTVKRNLYVQY